jgi:hypothetical protein
MQVAGILLALLCVTANYSAADDSAQERNAKSPGRILRAHTLEMEVEYMRLYENMSMKPPKGDKKNPKKCIPKPPPGPEDKDRPDDKGKGKGKGRPLPGVEREKGRRNGKGKGKGKGIMIEECPETESPSPSIAMRPSVGKFALHSCCDIVLHLIFASFTIDSSFDCTSSYNITRYKCDCATLHNEHDAACTARTQRYDHSSHKRTNHDQSEWDRVGRSAFSLLRLLYD